MYTLALSAPDLGDGIRRISEVASVSGLWNGLTEVAELVRLLGPGAFGRRSRFLTTLPSSVVLDSLTTKGADLGGKGSRSPGPQRGSPWPPVGSAAAGKQDGPISGVPGFPTPLFVGLFLGCVSPEVLTSRRRDGESRLHAGF